MGTLSQKMSENILPKFMEEFSLMEDSQKNKLLTNNGELMQILKLCKKYNNVENLAFLDFVFCGKDPNSEEKIAAWNIINSMYKGIMSHVDREITHTFAKKDRVGNVVSYHFSSQKKGNIGKVRRYASKFDVLSEGTIKSLVNENDFYLGKREIW